MLLSGGKGGFKRVQDCSDASMQRRDFAVRFKQLRKKRGLRQKELADLFDMDRSTITAYETRKRFPRPERLRRFADFFGVTLDYLTARSEPVPLDLPIGHLSPEMQAFVRCEVAAGCPWLHVIKEMLERGLTGQEIEKVLRLFVEVKEGAERKADSGSQPEYAPPSAKE